MGRSPRPRSRSPASTCSSAPTSTTRSRWLPVIRWPTEACSSSVRCGRDPPVTDARDALASGFAESWGRLVAGLIGWCGDWDLAEEDAQEAFAAAVTAWERDGVPAKPLPWLTTVARNRARDRLRRRTTEQVKLSLSAPESNDAVPATDDEDIP